MHRYKFKIFDIFQFFAKIYNFSRMVRSAAPPPSSNFRKCEALDPIHSQKTTNNVESRARLAGRGAQRGARSRAPARRDGSLSSGSGPAGPRLEPKRTLSHPSIRWRTRRSTEYFIYKSVELVSNPRTTHDLSDPSLRDGGAYVDPVD